MAPLNSEPSHTVVVLDPARREALYQLIGEIVAHMRSQLELDDKGNGCAKATTSLGQASAVSVTEGTEVESPTRIGMTAPGLAREHGTADAELVALRTSALTHFDEWKDNFLANSKGILDGKDGDRVLDERKGREEQIIKVKGDVSSEVDDLSSQEGGPSASNETQDWAKAVEAHQTIYQPVPTSLTTLRVEDRMKVLSAVLLLLLSTGIYSSHSRALMVYLISALELPLSVLNQEEKGIATTMIKMSSQADKAQEDDHSMPTEEEVQKQKQQNRASRLWKVGLASVAGAAALGVTGGLAGPVFAGAVGGLMSSVGLGGLASFLGIFWTKGALVGTLFGAFGAGMTGSVVDKYAREVQDFKFLPLREEKRPPEVNNDDVDVRRLRVTIGINGWLSSEDEVSEPWSVFGDDAEVFALRYEVKSLLKLGQALEEMVSSSSSTSHGEKETNKMEILPPAVLATLGAALWPVPLLKSAAGVDTPYHLAKNRSKKTGQILAQVLIDKVQGERPVTLVGYSLGAWVIFSCLKTLAERRAFGLVETVVLVGAPVPARRRHWQIMRSVVAGKIFHVFSRDDYVLAFLNRSTSDEDGIAGLQPVQEIEGLVNIDLSAEVKEHLDYPRLLGPVLKRCGFVDVSEKMVVVEEPPARNEEGIQSENNNTGAVPNGQRDAKDDVPGDEARTAKAPLVDPVPVKPLGKKFHRQISFPSGISKVEGPPVVKKIQSVVPVSGSPSGRRASLVKTASPGLAGSSSQGTSHKDDGSMTSEATKQRSTGDQ